MTQSLERSAKPLAERVAMHGHNIVPDLAQARKSVQAIRDRARMLGREIGIFTRAEIEKLNGVTPQSHPNDYELRRKQYVRGFPLCGDPETVTKLLVTLSDVGFDGIGLSFINYLDELPFVCDEVLPRLTRAGVRT